MMRSKFSEITFMIGGKSRKHDDNTATTHNNDGVGVTSSKKVDRSKTPVPCTASSSGSYVTPPVSSSFTSTDHHVVPLKDTVSDTVVTSAFTANTNSRHFLSSNTASFLSPRLISPLTVLGSVPTVHDKKLALAPTKSVTFAKDIATVINVVSYKPLKQELWYDGLLLQQVYRNNRLTLHQDVNACSYVSAYESARMQYQGGKTTVSHMYRCQIKRGVVLGYCGLEKVSSEITTRRKGRKQSLYNCLEAHQNPKVPSPNGTLKRRYVIDGNIAKTAEMLRYQCENITTDSMNWALFIGEIVEEASAIDADAMNMVLMTDPSPIFMSLQPSPLLARSTNAGGAISNVGATRKPKKLFRRENFNEGNFS